MKKIESFEVDHTRLKRGIYVSRKDRVGEEMITTFDIRMKEPNKEPVLDIKASHTIEHLGATFLRNQAEWGNKTIYFGPMGCRTGFYALFAGDLNVKDVHDILLHMLTFIAEYKGVIPGATEKECGNYKDHNLALAKKEADTFLKVLKVRKS